MLRVVQQGVIFKFYRLPFPRNRTEQFMQQSGSCEDIFFEEIMMERTCLHLDSAVQPAV